MEIMLVKIKFIFIRRWIKPIKKMNEWLQNWELFHSFIITRLLYFISPLENSTFLRAFKIRTISFTTIIYSINGIYTTQLFP